MCYRIDRPHDPSEDLAVAYNDPDLAIDWPLPVSTVSAARRECQKLGRVAHASAVIRRMDSSRTPLARSASRCGSRVNLVKKSSLVSPADVYSL